MHIGFMKTGTTALQYFLANNSNFLKEQGYYYPKKNREFMNILGFSLLDEMPPYIQHKSKKSRDQIYEELLFEIKNATENNIILSAESFSLVGTKLFLGEEAPRILKNLLVKENLNIKIIACIRRQDLYIESQYNQHVKNHNFFNLYTKSIQEFVIEKEDLFDFGINLSRWASYFGKENIKVFTYNKGQDIITDFLEVLGIEFSNVKQLNLPPQINSSLSSKVFEFVLRANNYKINKESAQLNNDLVEILEQTIGDSSKPSFFSMEERKMIMEKFYESNNRLSDSFLDGENSWMEFSPEEELNLMTNTLTIEDCIKVTSAIWNHFTLKQ